MISAMNAIINMEIPRINLIKNTKISYNINVMRFSKNYIYKNKSIFC